MDASGLCSRTRIQSHAIHIRFLWCMDSSGSDVHETLVWPIFQWANGFFRQDWACFFHCSMDRLISAWYHSSLPLPLRTPGHLIHLAIKRTRCMCASFPLLGFIWICSLGGPGCILFPIKLLYFCGPYLLLPIPAFYGKMATERFWCHFYFYSCC